MLVRSPHTQHAACLDNSARLQRVADLLADGREYSTLEIVLLAHVMAVPSITAELRRNGVAVAPARRVGSRWYYRRTDVPPPLGMQQEAAIAAAYASGEQPY